MNIDIPITLWQVFFIFTLIAAIPVGLYARALRIAGIKRKEMLRALHAEGEVEIIEKKSSYISLTEAYATLMAIQDLKTEGIISEHTGRVMENNRWKYWRVYRLVAPKGVSLVTAMFGSPPKPPPE